MARALALGAGVVLTGCATVSLVDLRIHTPRSHTVQATGVASPTSVDETLYDFLSIDLRAAPPFEFVFLDGHRVLSTAIDVPMLERHHAPLKPGQVGGLLGSARSGGDSSRGPYWSVVFVVAKDGRVMSLILRSCDQRLPGLLGRADGSGSFDFPIRQRELEELFGAAETLRYPAVLLERCRF